MPIFNDFIGTPSLNMLQNAMTEAFTKHKYPEFDPYISGARLFLTRLHWMDPFTGYDMSSLVSRIPINVMSIEFRRAVIKSAITHDYIDIVIPRGIAW